MLFYRDNTMEIIILLVQVILAITAIWYSYETRQVRRQNQQQLEFLIKQNNISISPFLIPTAKDSTTLGPEDIPDDVEEEDKKKMIEEFE